MKPGDVLDREVDAVKDHVEEHVEELDLPALIDAEEEQDNREELVLWLLQKERRRQLLNDDEALEHLLQHLEEAYRTAAISDAAYREAKQAAHGLLNN